MLAGGLGDQLLDPQAEARQRRRDHERELVAAGLRERARARLRARPGGCLRRRRRRSPRTRRCSHASPAPSSSARTSIAHQRRRHEPERRQRRVAPADVRVALERLAEAVLAARASARPEPGSVIATKWRPSPTSDQKCANSDSGSIVPPDFEETMNSVRSRSTALLHGADRSPRRSSRARAARGRSGAMARRSGAAPRARARSRPCRAAPRRCSPRDCTPRANSSSSSSVVDHPLGDRQPAEAVADLRRARRCPTASGRRRAAGRATSLVRPRAATFCSTPRACSGRRYARPRRRGLGRSRHDRSDRAALV